MDFLKSVVGIYWNHFLNIPLGWMEGSFHIDVYTAWKVNAWKGLFTLVLLFIVYEVYLFFRTRYRNWKMKEDVTPTITKEEAHQAGDQEFTDKLEAVKNPKQTIAALKKQKQYERLGQVYAALNKNKHAARAFAKHGNKRRAAMEWAKAGKTVRAAKLLEKAGDLPTAARFYAEKGKHAKAAQVYNQLGDKPNAAAQYARAGKQQEAVGAFLEYFQTSTDGVQEQVKAAEICFEMLQDKAISGQVGAAQHKQLQRAVAERFDAAQRSDLAAQLFRESGDPARAGQVYLRAGKLEEAARCMKEAGRTKEAQEIGARYYESKGLWKEAAMAYEGAEAFRRAGDCFSKAKDALNAARCYEQADEFFGAGFALVHAKQWENAIRMLQRVPEDHVNFDESRALLGRCFYHLKDYAHCAAALENHLTGARVNASNIDYFWMLALAYEQLGELEKSKAVLLKIRTVNVEYRDVSQRLSSINTRLTMAQAQDSSMMRATPVPRSEQATAVMDMVASQLGQRYKLDRELGRGGMGVIYLAQDTQLDRAVALKFLGSLVDGNEEYRQRFLREAKAAAKVSHPNIVSVYDIGTQEGKVYIAMEYIEGPNLSKYLERKGKLEPREAVNITGQACSALEAVHQAGIVHRDIKPDNIVITKGGLVKVMDFGLAKADDARLTAAGMVMGTPCYMAPEQARGEEVDPRTDIYALGLVLHELLTGQTVFADGDVLQRQLNEVPPPPGQVVEGIPKLLDQIVMKCVAKKPEERIQSAQELLAYLRQVGKEA